MAENVLGRAWTALNGWVDQFGKTVPRADQATMDVEISPVGALHARPPFMGHLAWDLNPQQLGAIMQAAATGSSLEWFILAEEIVELYPHLAALLAKRARQAAQLPITVIAADDQDPAARKHAELVEEWLETGVLQEALPDMLDAIGKGFSIHEIVWEQQPGRTRPAQLLYRPQRFFEFSPEDGQTIRLRTGEGFDDLVPHKFLIHRHPSKSGNTVRSGLIWMAAFLWCYATFTQKDWQLFVQGYGMPLRLGRYGPEASDGDKRVLRQAVFSIAGDVAAIIPKSMEIEFVEPGDRSAGTDLYLKRMNWLDQQVSKLVLGGTAGTDAISGGHAVGQEHRAAEQDVEKYDAFLLSTAITRQIVQTMVAFTFGPQAEYPVLVIGRPDEIPIKDIVEAVADLGGMGLKVKASEIRARLQLSEPEEGDETIGGMPAPVEKPAIPSPARQLPADGFTRRLFEDLFALHADLPDETMAALNERVAREAAGALHGMTEQVRAAFEAATDLHDLARRVHALKLDPKAFGEAMAQGMALAHLMGQAELLTELKR